MYGLASACGVLWATLLAQSLQPRPPASAQPPAIHTTTRLVEVSVIARERSGFAADLQKEDFRLVDDGKQRPIAVFSLARGARQTQTAAPLPPHTFSNRPEHRAVRPVHATVVLLDMLNTRVEHQAFARQQLIALLNQIAPREQIALYALGNSLHVLHDFTSDSRELARLLAHFHGESPGAAEASDPEPSSTGISVVDGLLNEINARFAYQANVDRTLATLNALEIIAGHLAGVPGRKSLIWVSSGFRSSVTADSPFMSMISQPEDLTRLGAQAGRRTFSPEMQRAARRASEANIAIYPVDASGLNLTKAFNPASNAAGSQWLGMPASSISAESARSAMEELAAWTGGRAFFDSNGLGRAIQSALEDAGSTYLLGFYLPEGDMDGRFHPLKVQVRRKGISLHYRKGYFPAVDRPLPETLQDVVKSPLEASRILLTMTVQRRGTSTPNLLDAVLSVDLRGVDLQRRAGVVTGHILVTFVQQDQTGAVLESSSEPLSFTFPEDTYAQLLRNGMPMGKAIPLKAGCAAIRAIVQDRTTGAFGSLIIPMSRVQ